MVYCKFNLHGTEQPLFGTHRPSNLSLHHYTITPRCTSYRFPDSGTKFYLHCQVHSGCDESDHGCIVSPCGLPKGVMELTGTGSYCGRRMGRWHPGGHNWWLMAQAYLHIAWPTQVTALCHPPHRPMNAHQKNVNRSGNNIQPSQTLRATSPVLPSTSRCSQTPLELRNVLSDSARAFSGGPESTCRYGGAFRKLRDLTDRIVKCQRSWDLCADLRETSTAAEAAAPLCGKHREQPRPLHSTAGDLVPSSHSSGSYTTTRHFVLSYLSVLQSQDSLHHNMACII